MVAIELKWITEPITTREIASRDEDLYKGLHIQLPNYQKGILSDINSFLINTFDEVLPIVHIEYFVMTNISIGSGVVNDDTNRIINFRMLKKSIIDHKGNLFEAVKALRVGLYLPQENIHYKKIENNYQFAGVNFITYGKEKLEPFSLNNFD